MKRLLLAAFAAASITASAQTNWWIIPDGIKTNGPIAATNITFKSVLDEPLTRSNLVFQLCATGEVCKQKGHNWRLGRPGETEGITYADWHPTTSYRTCAICGTCQSKSEEWK